jgi:hypothetical protein
MQLEIDAMFRRVRLAVRCCRLQAARSLRIGGFELARVSLNRNIVREWMPSLKMQEEIKRVLQSFAFRDRGISESAQDEEHWWRWLVVIG